MKNLIIPFLLTSLNLFSQGDTANLILGTWELKAFQIAPEISSLEGVNPVWETNSKSSLKLDITKDSITFSQNGYYRTPKTFSYTLKYVDFHHGITELDIVLHPDKNYLKKYPKKKRPGYEKIYFIIKKTNSYQLELQSLEHIDYPLDDFDEYTQHNYSFEKTSNDTLINHLTQNTGWFVQSNKNNILESDTITFLKDSIQPNGLRQYHLIFNKNYFEENILKGTDITPQFGNAVFYSFSNKTWFINNHQIIILSKGQQFTFNYKFGNNKLLLIKNGS
tara:strand:+ start:47 stop:880 length:834 start_codon:yes stop_codon:yes gene_type:complete